MSAIAQPPGGLLAPPQAILATFPLCHSSHLFLGIAWLSKRHAVGQVSCIAFVILFETRGLTEIGAQRKT